MFLGRAFRSRTALGAEKLFLRKQVTLSRERQVKPGRASDPMRLALVLLARCCARREALTSVQPATLLLWHRQAVRLLGRWRSRAERPRLPTISIFQRPSNPARWLPADCATASRVALLLVLWYTYLLGRVVARLVA